jgi:dipeptidyl-peptidase-3
MHSFFYVCLLGLVFACSSPTSNEQETAETTESAATDDADFQYLTETFADKKIIRYRIPGFDQLSLEQKKLVYYLTEAGLCGRDITYDQNYRHNVEIRKVIDNIVANYNGSREGDDWDNFMLYAKNFWFSSGIHHHYSNDKFTPEFSQDYFNELMGNVGASLSEEATKAIFDPTFDAKKISQRR